MNKILELTVYILGRFIVTDALEIVEVDFLPTTTELEIELLQDTIRQKHTEWLSIEETVRSALAVIYYTTSDGIDIHFVNENIESEGIKTT